MRTITNRPIYFFSLFFVCIATNIGLLPCTLAGNSEDGKEKQFSFSFYGFVNYEMSFDTRQVIAAREGNVVLFPAPVKADPAGNDINAQTSIAYYVLTSRFGSRITGPEIMGAKSSAVFEGDFLGTQADKFHHLRLRHAFIQLNWENSAIIAGQYWHPLFIPTCFPDLVNFGGSVPYHVLSRAPQLRFSHQISNLILSAMVLTQGDFPSTGPQGPSSIYLRNSSTPEAYLQSVFSTPLLDVGASLGYMTLKPRLETPAGFKTTETIGGMASNLWFKFNLPALTIKVQGIYGENMTHLIMLGGYGETDFLDIEKEIRGYSAVRTGSVWTDFETTGKRYRVGFFAGYSENLGSKEEITGSSWVRGGNIAYIYRLSPRARLIFDNFSINAEIFYDVAAYGNPDLKFKVHDAEEVNNIRFLATLRYNF